jgi:hypothetical protein
VVDVPTRALKRWWRGDDGFTLSELIIVTGLLGFIVAAAWAGMAAISKAGTVSSNATTASHDLSIPLEQISKIVMQNTTVKSTAPNRIEVWTDRNLDDLPELDAFYADAAGELVWESWFYDSARTTYTKHTKWVFSENNANVSSGSPLFTYYDKAGNVITDMEKAPSKTYYMRAVVKVRLDDHVVDGARTILFRNRS